MIPRLRTEGYSADGIRLYPTGGGSSTPTNVSSTTSTSNIPAYAQPYVENMLGATEAQLFNTQGATNPDGTPLIDPSTGQQVQNITGFSPYQAYGSTDANGNPVSATQAAQSAVASFQPLQTQAQQGIGALQTPDQYNQAMNQTNQGIAGFGNSVNQAGQYGQAGYNAGQQYAGQSADIGNQAVQSGQQYAGQSAGLAGQANQLGQQYANQSANYGGMGAMAGAQGANIGASLGQQSQNASQGPGSVYSYMNPYIQNSLNPSLQLLNQQYGQQQVANQGAATQAGAFGGSRMGVQQALTNQGQNLAQQQLIGNAYNTAFGNAQQQMNAANQAALSGNAQALQGAGVGLQGAAQAGQLGLQGVQQAGQLTGQAGSQAMQGYTTGLQGANQAGSQAMQGSQLGLAGVNAQQTGLGQQLAGANQLANLGQQQLASQENIYNMQNQVGAQQQQYNQNVINQAMQNYANAQQYPIMQLGTMSNMLRGLPMQATTTNQYQAPPSLINQVIGAGGAAATIGALSKAKGGILKTGINSYDVGGAIRADLENMPTDALQEELKKTQSPTIKSDIQQIMAMRSAVPQAKAGGIMSYADGEKVLTPSGINEGNAGEAEAAANMQSGINTVAPEFKSQPVSQQQQQLGIAGINQLQNPTERAFFSNQYNDLSKQLSQSDDERIQNRQNLYDKYLGKDTTLSELTKEKANAKAEGERQRQLRLGEFFAKWGSTPGPVLASGLSAFAKTVPHMIEDSDRHAGIMQKIDDSIIQVNRADRLEKMGNINGAMTEKKEAADRMQKLGDELRRIITKQEDDKRARDLEISKEANNLQRTKIEAESRVTAAGIGAGSRQQDDLKNALAANGLALQRQEAVYRDIDNVKKTTTYDMLKREVDNLATKIARNPKDANAQVQYQTKKDELDTINKGFQDRINTANNWVNDTNLFVEQAYGKKGIKRGNTSDNTSSNAPDPNDPLGLNKKK